MQCPPGERRGEKDNDIISAYKSTWKLKQMPLFFQVYYKILLESNVLTFFYIFKSF
jgi:hypothetical protein